MVTSKYFIGASVVGVVAVTAVALNRPAATAESTAADSNEKPNVIIVLLDDLGSMDVGFGGSLDIKTPHIDRIANEGVNCSEAYISAPYSGPSRCGIMSGRYQQRFGAEGNLGDDSVVKQLGVPLTETLMSNVMQEQGYATCAIGKWHLGDHESRLPHNRGFDYFYGFSGGGHSFWGAPIKNSDYKYVQRNGELVLPTKTTYLTDEFSREAVEFIDKTSKTDNPFYIYLAYNAPHAPLQAPQRYLDRTKHIHNAQRSVYAAMVLAVDDGIGQIWEALERNNQLDNTMIIFLSDNGGTGDPGRAMNYPRRAFKGNMFDGGIRTPFAIYWKGRLQAGTTYDKTISSLDIFPTVVTAAGFDPANNKNPLDGVDLVPYLTGKKSSNPHKSLCWRVCGGMEYAIRMGDYKLVKTYYQDDYMLFNLKEDPIEMTDIAACNGELVKKMAAEYMKWNSEMLTPSWEDNHAPHQIKDHEDWELYRKKASGGRK